MKAEVIAIGDELTSGQRLDTNSQWLSQQLGELGIQTIRHTAVSDDLSENVEAFQQAARRVDLVVCTGGLGPTQDDLTRQALAESFNRPLREDAESLEHIRQLFLRRGREMPDRNRVQALLPLGSQVIPNPHGSAPGIDLSLREADSDCQCRIFALPGVPAEMRQMWGESVLPRIETLLGKTGGPLHYKTVKIFGIGESEVEARLPELIARERQPRVGITASRTTITLRIVARAHSADQFEQIIEPTLREIQDALGHFIYGFGDMQLEHVVLNELESQDLTLASLEIGAASWIGDWMLKATNPSAANPLDNTTHATPRGGYGGSLAFPKLHLARQWLLQGEQAVGVKQDESANHSKITPLITPELEDYRDLAHQTRRRFATDLGLAVGTYPSLSAMHSATTTFNIVFALALNSEQTLLEQRSLGGHPDVLGPRIAKTGLDLVRYHLLGLPREKAQLIQRA